MWKRDANYTASPTPLPTVRRNKKPGSEIFVAREPIVKVRRNERKKVCAVLHASSHSPAFSGWLVGCLSELTEEEEKLKIAFWNGTYQDALGSIFPQEDICSLIPPEEADIAILEEPEHLNWFRVPREDANEQEMLGWAHKFKHVVGILHTYE